MAINELDQPIQHGSDDASNEEKVKGIVEQVRQDVKLGHVAGARDELMQRFAETGTAVDESRVDELVRDIDGS